ncbi:WD40 repeat domain-containing protein [Polyangium aurulentum]|uniref:WD40 repeat domain-containing protein n=1 Tax=Polyangium aurulentum TaxID=2567896 RepID=UPI0010AE93AE|nr:hypothetical protein [Polyangium aurulentum]UQA55608.1 hypothetical protein E8A73_030235 [Polyangium aurulentum]
MRNLILYLIAGGVALFLLVLVAMVAVVGGSRAAAPAAPASSASARVAEHAPAPPDPMSFSEGRVDLVPERRVGLEGMRSQPNEEWVERGSVWVTPSGRGFGRHIARSLHLLSDPAWILVHADSGLWLLEAQTLARRARLKTGTIAAIDVSTDGRRIAYAEYTPPLERVADAHKDEEPADLVVLEFPSLVEIHRARVMKPAQVRFSPDGRTVASAAKNGATVVPLDGRGAPWTTTRAPGHSVKAVAVVPLDGARVAYMADSGELILQDRATERVVHTYDMPSTNFIFFRMYHPWREGLLHYNAALDRVLSIRDSEALVVDAASTESPRLGKPINLAGSVDAMRPYAFMTLNELELRIGVESSGSRALVLAALGARGDASFVSSGTVIHFERGRVLRSPDFGDIEEGWLPSPGEHDVVFTTIRENARTVRRVSLSTPALDITPERVGTFVVHSHADPFLFENGDRFFPVVDWANHGGIVRLPRGGSVQPIEWLDVKPMDFGLEVIRSEGRVALVNWEAEVVEVTPESARVLGQIKRGDGVSWNVKKKCWEVAASRGKRFLCAPR